MHFYLEQIMYLTDNDNGSNFLATNYINHITRDIQARWIEVK